MAPIRNTKTLRSVEKKKPAPMAPKGKEWRRFLLPEALWAMGELCAPLTAQRHRGARESQKTIRHVFFLGFLSKNAIGN